MAADGPEEPLLGIAQQLLALDARLARLEDVLQRVVDIRPSPTLECAFCGRKESDVRLLTGRAANICTACVAECVKVLEELDRDS